MRRSLIGTLSLALLTGLTLTATSAAADCDNMREFTGKVQKFKKTGKKAGFLLDNNQGDKVSFRKPENVEVVDQRAEKKAEKWEDLKNGMWVGTCWKFTDKPRLAYKVMVKEQPKDAASDE